MFLKTRYGHINSGFRLFKDLKTSHIKQRTCLLSKVFKSLNNLIPEFMSSYFVFKNITCNSFFVLGYLLWFFDLEFHMLSKIEAKERFLRFWRGLDFDGAKSKTRKPQKFLFILIKTTS